MKDNETVNKRILFEFASAMNQLDPHGHWGLLIAYLSYDNTERMMRALIDDHKRKQVI